jgi:hypothetical protein
VIRKICPDAPRTGKKQSFLRYADVLILAVGFGVELEEDSQSSYWADDSIDGSFLTNRNGQKWLVSGCGDGGLTDLIRLCIRRFRHEKILSLFPDSPEFEYVKSNLSKKHAATGTTDPKFPNQKTKDYGRPVGTGANGGDQTRVRVHEDSRGKIHGHPDGPEQ